MRKSQTERSNEPNKPNRTNYNQTKFSDIHCTYFAFSVSRHADHWEWNISFALDEVSGSGQALVAKRQCSGSHSQDCCQVKISVNVQKKTKVKNLDLGKYSFLHKA